MELTLAKPELKVAPQREFPEGPGCDKKNK